MNTIFRCFLFFGLMNLISGCNQQASIAQKTTRIETQEPTQNEKPTTVMPTSPGYVAKNPESLCGNGVIDMGEQCDGGAAGAAPRCNALCLIETSFNPSYPYAGGGGGGGGAGPSSLCGNGVIDTGEECDDTNQDNNDGCSNRCLFTANNPPLFRGLTNIATAGGDTVLLNWLPALDQFTPSPDIVYNIYMASAPGQQNFNQPLMTTEPGQTQAMIDMGAMAFIAQGPTFYFVVRALNQDGFEEDNQVELSITLTPANFIAFVSDTAVGMGTLGDPFDPYQTIQAAINAIEANGGGTVLVDAALNGTLYNEELNFSQPVTDIAVLGGFNRFSSLPINPTGQEILSLRDVLNYPTTVGGAGLPYNDGDLIRITNTSSPTIIDGFTVDGDNGCDKEIQVIDGHFQMSGNILDQNTCLFADSTVSDFDGIIRVVGNQVLGENIYAFTVGGGVKALYVQNNNVSDRGLPIGSRNTNTNDIKVQTLGSQIFVDHNQFINGYLEDPEDDEDDNVFGVELSFSPAFSDNGGDLDIAISHNEIRDFDKGCVVNNLAAVGENGTANLMVNNNLFHGFGRGVEINCIDEDPFAGVDIELNWVANTLYSVGSGIGLDINDVTVSAGRTTQINILDSVFSNSESEIIEITDRSSNGNNTTDEGMLLVNLERNSIFSGEDSEIEIGTAPGGYTHVRLIENAVLGSEDEGFNIDIEDYLGPSDVERSFPDGTYFLTIFNNDIHGGDDESFELRDDRGTSNSAAFVYVGRNYMADSPDPSEVGVDFDSYSTNGFYLFERNFIGIGGQDSDSAFDASMSSSSLGSLLRLQNNVLSLANGAGIEMSRQGTQAQVINNTIAYNGERNRYGVEVSINEEDNAQIFIANTIVSHSAEADLEPGVESTYSLIRDGENGLGFASFAGEPLYLRDFSTLPFPITIDQNLNDIFRLSPTSPAIDAGNPKSWFNDPDNTRNDVGAYGGPGAGLIGFENAGAVVPLTWVGVFPAVGLYTGAGLTEDEARITIAFNKPINPATLNVGISIKSGGFDVPGLFSVSGKGHLVSFVPYNDLTQSGDDFVQITLNKNLKDSDNRSLGYPSTIRVPIKPSSIAEQESNGSVGTAQLVGFGPSPDVFVLEGSATDNTDEDFYAFSANAGDRLMVSIFDSRTTLVTDGSYEIELWDASSTLIKKGSIDCFSSDPYLDTVLTSSGTYYLRVRNPGVAGSTNYELQAVLD